MREILITVGMHTYKVNALLRLLPNLVIGELRICDRALHILLQNQACYRYTEHTDAKI